MKQTLEIICNRKKELVNVSIPEQTFDKEAIITLRFIFNNEYFSEGRYDFYSPSEKEGREHFGYDAYDMEFLITNRKNIKFYMGFNRTKTNMGVNMSAIEKVDIDIGKAVKYFISLSEALVKKSCLNPSFKNILNEAYKRDLKESKNLHKIFLEAKEKGKTFYEFIKDQDHLEEEFMMR